jgi:subtilase family serine protease
LSRPAHALAALSLAAASALPAGRIPLRPQALAQAAAPVAAAPGAPDRLLLPGNVHPALAGARQLGPAEPQGPMAGMILLLRPRAGAEAALEALLADQQDPAAPDFHRWLTPEQFGERFGPAPADLERAAAWLRSQGFTVDDVAAGRMTLLFSGTAAQAERAFRTPIRRFEIDGEAYQANLEDPSIPAALADVVAGVVSLHDIPHPALNTGFRTDPGPGLEQAKGHPIVPGDFAAIYGVEPLYRDGLDGTGVSIAVVGRTHIPLADVEEFRRLCGLPPKPVEIILNGPDPGDLGPGENGEAHLDVEWAGAVARNATIRLVVSPTTSATDGVDLSARYIVDHNLAPVMSTSFGQCESQLGRTEMAFYRSLWAQAAVQGISAIVASGDSGPAGCNGGSESAGTGQAVSGLASTPFDLAVGGTQFNDPAGDHWRPRKGKDGSSALGYIPERAWNESGSVPGGTGLWATGGGPSPAYRRPCWQMAPGLPCHGVQRSIPDVSLNASSRDGYVIQSGGRRRVTGGTSCSCPAFAGLMALVVQKTGERQGNPAQTLYKLGRAQFKGTGPAVFHDIQAGDNTVPGTEGFPCTPGTTWPPGWAAWTRRPWWPPGTPGWATTWTR